MTTKVLICDDSNMARNQLKRCLPENWDIEVLFAEDGRHGLDIVIDEQPELMFLDLNMPILDGYETLEEINTQALNVTVIVVSGDIQPLAKERVLSLGAINFIKKPTSKESLLEVLSQAGFYSEANQATVTEQINKKGTSSSSNEILTNDKAFLDACQEVANIAMGRAGNLLARFLNAFIELPIPKVNHIELSELHMALQAADQDQSVSSVCQGFMGVDIAGEALLIFNDSSFTNIAKLIRYEGEIDSNKELELIMDVSNIIVGACLKSFSDQLSINFSQSHPVVLGQHIKVPELIGNNVKQWNKALTIEINYSIENQAINCDLLLLFDEDSIEPLRKRISYLV